MSEPRNISNSGATVANPEVVMEVQEANAKYLLPAERQIPKGYKQTEVGVIPEDWDVVDYALLGQVIDGDRGIHYPSAGELNNSGDCLFLNAGNVTKNGFRFTDCQFISREKDKKLNKGKLDLGDVVLTTRGTLGNFAYFSREIAFNEMRINSGMVILRNTSTDIDTEYQYLVLKSSIVESQIERISFGSAQPQLTVKGISSLKIPIPPTKAEQEAIAEALSDADALIEALEQLVAKKRQLKQGAMHELLTGKRRLSGFSGEWELKPLGEFIEKIVGGGTPSRSNPDYWGDEIPWVTVKDFATFNPRYSQESISKAGLQNSASHLIPRETLITSTRMGLGKAVIYDVDVAINQDLKALFPKNLLLTHYLYFWFQYYGRLIEELGSGSTVKGISLSELKKIAFHLPSLPEQTAIAQILTDMDTEITGLETKLIKARAVKQGMMQQLLTGKIRLL